MNVSACHVLGEEPDNAHLKQFIKSGGFSAVFYSEATPLFILDYLIEDLNSKNGLLEMCQATSGPSLRTLFILQAI